MPQAPAPAPDSEEIERVFLVADRPADLASYPAEEILTGYLAVTAEGKEVRIRRKGTEDHELTVKSPGTLVRREVPVSLTREQFETLLPEVLAVPFRKTRSKLPHGDATLEYNVYHDELDGLEVVEVEFTSVEDSTAFQPPAWLGPEVTEDPRFKNKTFALIPASEIRTRILALVDEVLPPRVPEYGLEDGVDELAHRAKVLRMSLGRPVVVLVAGGSASGKTSAVARRLVVRLPGATLLSMDDYYRGGAYMQEQADKGIKLNWDQPEAQELSLLRAHLAELKAGRVVEKPRYAFRDGGVREGLTPFSPAPYIVVEGLFALHADVRGEGDMAAFVDIDTHGRILRRVLRDVERTGQTPAEILRQFAETVEPMHARHVQTTLRHADLVIRNDYLPVEEAARSGLQECQLKFRAAISPEQLRRLGAEHLGSTRQRDFFYHPANRSLDASDEMLRVREEEGHMTLTYKGPRTPDAGERTRPKLEFPLDADAAAALLRLYGQDVRVVTKDRTLYLLPDGVVASVDRVDGLGTFLEVRSTRPIPDTTLELLGLTREEGITESYLEMVA